MKPKCRALVPNKWYDKDAWPGRDDHPCPFFAIRDGWCARHHPENLLPILERKEASLASKLIVVRSEIEQVRARREAQFPLNPS
jgi:hypothetical protein